MAPNTTLHLSALLLTTSSVCSNCLTPCTSPMCAVIRSGSKKTTLSTSLLDSLATTPYSLSAKRSLLSTTTLFCHLFSNCANLATATALAPFLSSLNNLPFAQSANAPPIITQTAATKTMPNASQFFLFTANINLQDQVLLSTKFQIQH